eukprot:symbB.v1.2.029085.t1/scaffold3150.1/size62411/3
MEKALEKDLPENKWEPELALWLKFLEARTSQLDDERASHRSAASPNNEAGAYGALPVLRNGPDGGVTPFAEAAQKTSAELGAVNGLSGELMSLLRGEAPQEASDDESPVSHPQTIAGMSAEQRAMLFID